MSILSRIGWVVDDDRGFIVTVFGPLCEYHGEEVGECSVHSIRFDG